MRTILNMNLREKRDHRSANMLAQLAPNDFVPAGAEFAWEGRPNCQRGTDDQDWCYVEYRKFHGYLASKYMEFAQ